MLFQVFNSLAPLAVLVALGAVLLRTGFTNAAFCKGMDRLVYWVALPALIVRVLAEAPSSVGDGSLRMTGVLCGATVATAVLAWGLAAVMRVPRASVGVMVQASFRGNLAFVGLPVIDLATGGDSLLLAKAAYVFAPTVVLYNVLAVAGLIAAQHRLDAALPIRMLKSLALNPLLIACVVGLVLGATGVQLPSAAGTSLELLGRPAGPLALLSLGAVLATYPVKQHVSLAAVTAVLKCGLVPLLAWALALAVGLPDDDVTVVLIFSACPTAVASYVLATQLRGDAALAAATIVLSTLVSGLALAGVLALTA